MLPWVLVRIQISLKINERDLKDLDLPRGMVMRTRLGHVKTILGACYTLKKQKENKG